MRQKKNPLQRKYDEAFAEVQYWAAQCKSYQRQCQIYKTRRDQVSEQRDDALAKVEELEHMILRIINHISND